MAKATITIEDVEGEEKAININYDFTPELPTDSEDPDVIKTDNLTSAQILAMNLFDLIQDSLSKTKQVTDEAKEANYEQTEEGTCCGGACHPTTEG